MSSSSQGGPVKWGHPDTPGHLEKTLKLLPPPLSCPSEPLPIGETHTQPRSTCDHYWPATSSDPGPWPRSVVSGCEVSTASEEAQT